MRNASLIIGAAMILLAGAGAALAQNVDGGDALSTNAAGAMSCGQYAQLDTDAREKLVRQLVLDTAPRSLVDMPSDSTEYDSKGQETVHNEAAQPVRPLTTGDLTSACQAASLTSTLRDAYSRSNPFLGGNG